ncbi:MAG TPA: TRAP transporter small permease [Magnetospirillaceae bacterium]|nr:TRAP transporter small permease [Magnetospirillaceae bacterium]
MFSKLLQRTVRILETMAAVLFIAILGFTSLNIILRNVLGISWIFVEGLLRLMFIWMVFLGTAALYYRGDHLVMDFFQGKMPPRMQNAVILCGELLFLAVAAVLIVYGIEVTRIRMGIPFETWDVPTGYAFLAVPVNASIMALFCVNRILERVRR